MWTLGEIKSAIQTEMQLDPGVISDSERTRYINNCIDDLNALGLFDKIADIVLTDGLADLPTDFGNLITITYNNIRLKPASPTYVNSGTAPLYYSVGYKQLQIYPQPDGICTCRIRYTYKLPDLVADADIPELPEGYGNMLFLYAVAMANRKNGNIGIANVYYNDYMAKKNDFINEMTIRHNTNVNDIHNQEVDNIPFYEPFRGINY